MSKYPKLIAFHLPQYHCIKENDEWWGKGFTEWTNIKKSKPLFKNHNQPRVPLNKNYYNMLDKETLIKQAELANQYGVYGFCFYHYWFGGKLLLEKPVENLLQWKDINLNYCFSWANEPWSRTWDGQNKVVLMPQNYGSTNEWIKHYNYLSSFFKDNRYIKIDNKPVMLLYRTNNIPHCDEMIQTWNELAINDGFNGIFIVETINHFQETPSCSNSKAIVYMEPTVKDNYSFKNQFFSNMDRRLSKFKFFLKSGKWLYVEEYDTVWNKIISRKTYNKKDKRVYLGAFVGWDNSPRKGENSRIIVNQTPEKFKKYLKIQLENSCSDFLFINAWNEWAEGAYLEPDEKDGYNYLKMIKELIVDKEGHNEE